MKTPEAPALPAELDALLRRMRLPYFRRLAPEVCVDLPRFGGLVTS
jgi:hypothetical protein